MMDNNFAYIHRYIRLIGSVENKINKILINHANAETTVSNDSIEW